MNSAGLSSLARREVARIIKVINQSVFPPIVSSLLFLTIFYFVLGRGDGENYLQFLVPGLVMMSIINNSFQNSGFSLFISKYTMHFRHLLTMPLSAVEILLGYLAGSVVRAFLTAVGIIIATAFFVTPTLHSITVTLAAFLLASVLFGTFGILAALWADQFDQLGMVTTFAITPLTMLGGVFYSLDRLPDTVATLTKLNPIFYLVDTFRYGMLGQSDASPWLGLGLMLLFTVILFSLAVHLLRRGWRVKE